MRDKTVLANSQGFTLIEMMVSAMLLAILVMAVSTEFALQRKREQALVIQTSGRNALTTVMRMRSLESCREDDLKTCEKKVQK